MMRQTIVFLGAALVCGPLLPQTISHPYGTKPHTYRGAIHEPLYVRGSAGGHRRRPRGRANSFTVVNHPNYGQLTAQQIRDLVADAVEVYNPYNGATHVYTEDNSTHTKVDTIYTAGVYPWLVASDDAHTKTVYDGNDSHHVGWAWLMVNADSLSVADIMAALRAGTFYGARGPHLAFNVSGITITVTASNLGGSTGTVEWFKSGGVVAKTDNDVAEGGTASYVALGDEQYVRVRVSSSNASYIKAWSNPFFIHTNSPVTEEAGLLGAVQFMRKQH